VQLLVILGILVGFDLISKFCDGVQTPNLGWSFWEVFERKLIMEPIHC
jgi:hypothetical protein